MGPDSLWHGAYRRARVTHVSYYEAEAYARWSGRRLPTEHEWEHAAEGLRIQGNLQESGLYHPVPADGNGHAIEQMIGDVWEWTQSPPLRPLPGLQAVGRRRGRVQR